MYTRGEGRDTSWQVMGKINEYGLTKARFFQGNDWGKMEKDTGM